MHIHHKELLDIYNNLKASNCSNKVLLTRARRALSWLEKSEKENSQDAKFIFLWISLNCTYSKHTLQEDDRDLRNNFFELILESDDKKKSIWYLLNERYPEEITLIINNEHIYIDFWKDEKHSFNQQKKLLWQASMDYENNKITDKLIDSKNNKSKEDVIYILNILFSRLYVLRNQIFHGGSTFEGSVNRTQVDDGSNLMQYLVPLFIKIMLENPQNSYSEVPYPPSHHV